MYLANDNHRQHREANGYPNMTTHMTGTRDAQRAAVALGIADWLSLAAAPTFATMALLTAMPGGGPLDMLCSATQDASPLGGMVVMYVLMSAFHAASWLKLIAGRRGADRRS